MPALVENILIMFATVAVLLGGGYLLLIILGWGLKIKSGHREQEGLTDLWMASQTDKTDKKDKDHSDGKSDSGR